MHAEQDLMVNPLLIEAARVPRGVRNTDEIMAILVHVCEAISFVFEDNHSVYVVLVGNFTVLTHAPCLWALALSGDSEFLFEFGDQCLFFQQEYPCFFTSESCLRTCAMCCHQTCMQSPSSVVCCCVLRSSSYALVHESFCLDSLGTKLLGCLLSSPPT